MRSTTRFAAIAKAANRLLVTGAGYPHLGESAIDPMIDVLHDLNHEAWPSSEDLGDTTLNIGMMSGGIAANAVPDSASAMLMFRLTTEPDVIMNRVKVSLNGPIDHETLC